jgi:hypothetical protein
MENGTLNKVEDLYLKIFKIVILVVLSITLVVSVVMVLKGTSEYFATPSAADPAKSAPTPSVSVDAFIKELDKKDAPPEKEPTAPVEQKPPVQDTRLDDMVDKYVLNLWTYLDAYQKACKVANPPEKETFLKNFRKDIMKSWFEEYGENFAKSQDTFEKSLLSNQRIIQICIEKEGKAGIFFRSLDWHKNQWAKQVKEGQLFEQKEAQRVAKFEAQEAMRVAEKKAQAFQSLITAISAFVMFMSLALLLIFSKIETNLRGVKIIEKEVRE